MKGELRPGQQLKEERTLARRLGTSATPIRSALARLEQEFLVSSVPHQGTFVVGLSADDIFEAYEVCRLLEGRAAALAPERISTETLSELDTLLASIEKEVARDNCSIFADADLEFHRSIALSTNQQWLARFVDMLDDHVYRIARILV